jgi:hypothetical protein
MDTESHTKSHLRFGAKKSYKVLLLGQQIAATPNRTCDMQQIGHEIAHKIPRVISPLDSGVSTWGSRPHFLEYGRIYFKG